MLGLDPLEEMSFLPLLKEVVRVLVADQLLGECSDTRDVQHNVLQKDLVYLTGLDLLDFEATLRQSVFLWGWLIGIAHRLLFYNRELKRPIVFSERPQYG